MSGGISSLGVTMTNWRLKWQAVHRGATTSFQVYTRASSCEWAPLLTVHSRFESFIVHELRLTFNYICFRLFSVDSGLSCTISTLSKRAWALCYWQTGRSWRAFWQTRLGLLVNKLLFYMFMVRWLCFVSPKTTFEACFACSTPYNSRSDSARQHFAQPRGLPVSRQSVSRTPYTAS